MKNEKQKALINLKKSKSLIETIIKMVEEDQYCISIMQQNLAVIGLLKSANQTLMEGHLHHCFANALESNKVQRKEEMIEEILTVTKLLNK
ncbi:MAG: metal-sensing transcriptional repressor [Candidatus Dojkabacteria bacterium]|jgi:DNA-binding FrmR family transcriptional regulator|nr:metal-sensing transcriptional repressor [Candidatus Dojkabacteria bacterium]